MNPTAQELRVAKDQRMAALQLAERLEQHVTSRGGLGKNKYGQIANPNGAWQMMLDAAELLRSLAAAPAPPSRQAAPADVALEIAERILGKCSCTEAYTARKLIAPDCVWHHCSEELVEELAAQRKAGMLEAARIADGRANTCFLAAEATDDPTERCAGIEAVHIADLIRAASEQP